MVLLLFLLLFVVADLLLFSLARSLARSFANSLAPLALLHRHCEFAAAVAYRWFTLELAGLNFSS